MRTMRRTYSLPKDLSKISPAKSYAVPTTMVNVPRERVTAVYTPELEEEFRKSVESQGIKDDVSLFLIDGSLWLDDGLHRLQEAERLSMPTVPAKIQKGTISDLVLSNIMHARQRGKSNPAQEAESLAFIVHKQGYPIETAAGKLGMSPAWAKRLIRIATLPDEIKDYVKHGKIPVTGAFYLADLSAAAEQISVAKDAVLYSYNVYQIKTRVAQLLNPDIEPEEGGYTFNSKGKPQKIPLRCHFCGDELPDTGKQYIWCCATCEGEAMGLLNAYRKHLKEGTSPLPPSPPETPPTPKKESA